MATKTLIPTRIKGNRVHNITKHELSIILQEVDGKSCTFISMFSQTKPDMVLKNKVECTINPYWKENIEKVSHSVGMINFNYTNAVNNQREREGLEADFVAQLNWHTKKYDRVNGCVGFKAKAGSDSEQEYMFFIPTHSRRLGFLLNGRICTPIENAVIKSFLAPKTKNKSQGTEKEIPFRSYKLESIKLIRINKKVYRIVG